MRSEVLLHPLAPFRIVDREHGSVALLPVETRQETLSGGADWRSRNTGGMNAEEARLDSSAGRNAFEWLGKTLALVIGRHPPESLGHVRGVLREGVGGKNSARDQGRKQRPARQARCVVMVLVGIGVVVRDSHVCSPGPPLYSQPALVGCSLPAGQVRSALLSDNLTPDAFQTPGSPHRQGPPRRHCRATVVFRPLPPFRPVWTRTCHARIV